MQFGVQFSSAADHTDKSAADDYAESLAIAEEAERLGFTHARTSQVMPEFTEGAPPTVARKPEPPAQAH